ncbi:MAG: metal-dependent transcriptional regulator [Methanothrix sp.]|nr:metal-dependent transcriptional regulator [Methanothrix sp.]
MRKKTIEEYIEVIFALEREEGRATTGRIAAEMNVKPSSATEMLQKLQKEGFLQYESYAGAKLTESGRRLALDLEDKHEAIADFLAIIGVDRAVAERDACQIEHHVGQETMERLERFVQFAYHFSNPPGWIECFRRYCETGRMEDCDQCLCSRSGNESPPASRSPVRRI